MFATALAVARTLGAHLNFLHVRVDLEQVLMAMALADICGGTGCDQIMESLEQDAAVRQRKAELVFRDFCERERLPISSDPATALPSVEWRMETGDEPTWLAERGRAADLSGGRTRPRGEAVARDVLEAAVMASGRLVLIAPARPLARITGTVAIAWKNRARRPAPVAAARPFVALADRAIILSVDEGTETDRQSPE
jgi:hypothetical protein